MSKNVWDSIDELFDNSNRNENELDQNVLLGIEDDDYELFMSKEQEDEVKEVKVESRSKEEFIENEKDKTIDETNDVNIEQEIETEGNIEIKDNNIESEELNSGLVDKDENEVIEENDMRNDEDAKEALDDNNVDEHDDVSLTADKSPSNITDDVHDIPESSNEHRSKRPEFEEDDEDDDEINKSANRDKRWSERSEEDNLNKNVTNINNNNNNNNIRNNNNQQFHSQRQNFMNRQDLNRNKNKMIEHNQFMQNRPRFNFTNMQIPGPPPPLHSHLMDQPPPLQFPFSQPPPPPFTSFHQSASSYILPFPNGPNPIMFQDLSLHPPPPGPSPLINPHLMIHRPPLIERPPLLHMYPPHPLAPQQQQQQPPNNTTSQMASGPMSLPPSQQNSFYFNNQNQGLVPPLSDSLEEILRQQVNRQDTMYKAGQLLIQQSDNRSDNRPYRREHFSNNQNFTDLNRVIPDQRQQQPLMEQNVRKRVSDQGINKPALVKETSNQQKPNNNNSDPPKKIKKVYNGQMTNDTKPTEKVNDQQMTSPAPSTTPSTTTPAPVVVIDDPEYIKKLEEQKRKREEILKLKELKRAQRIKELNVKKQTTDSDQVTANTAATLTASISTVKSTIDMQETNKSKLETTETSLVKTELNTARKIQVINETTIKQEPSKPLLSSIKNEPTTTQTNSNVNNKPEVKFQQKLDQSQRSVVTNPLVNNTNTPESPTQQNINFNDPFHTRNYLSQTQNSENCNQITRSFPNSTSSSTAIYRPFLANYHEHQQLYQYNAKSHQNNPSTYQYIRNPSVYQLNNKNQNMKILNSNNNNNNNNTSQNIDNSQNQVKINNNNFQTQNQQQQQQQPKKSTPVTVILQNISTSTSEKSIYDMCNVLHIKDKVMKITMENSLNKAEILFTERDSADKFFKQYNRTLVDLSIITVKLL